MFDLEYIIAAGISLAASSFPIRAQSAIDPKLAAQASISLDSARAIALHRVARGTIAAQELEREHGRLIYSFDMRVPGKQGIDEVNVNAIDGSIVGVHHEGPATERREAKEDSIAAARRRSAPSSP